MQTPNVVAVELTWTGLVVMLVFDVRSMQSLGSARFLGACQPCGRQQWQQRLSEGDVLSRRACGEIAGEPR